MVWNMSALWKDGISDGLKGLSTPVQQRTVELDSGTIARLRSDIAKNTHSSNLLEGLHSMATLIEQIEQGLAEHEQAIATIEGFMEKHATEAANAIDPLRLQTVLAKVKEHTMRLGAVMAKFPLVSPEVPVVL
jgi:hypothetical protein